MTCLPLKHVGFTLMVRMTYNDILVLNASQLHNIRRNLFSAVGCEDVLISPSPPLEFEKPKIIFTEKLRALCQYFRYKMKYLN